MPINLEDLGTGAAQAVRSLTPKYFHRELTGSGKKTGLINQFLRPDRYPVGSGKATADSTHIVDRKSKSSSGDITNRTIPTGTLSMELVHQLLWANITMVVPEDTQRFHVNPSATNLDHEVYLALTPQGLRLFQNSSEQNKERRLDVAYRMEVYVIEKGTDPQRVPLVASPSKNSFVMINHSFHPLDDAEDLIASATRHLVSSSLGVRVGADDLAAWMADYDVYERICDQAEKWAGEGIGQELTEVLDELYDPSNQMTLGDPSNNILNALAHQMRYLESHNVSLEAYRIIHTGLRKHCTDDDLELFAKQNLNLLMTQTLAHLDDLKPQLSKPVGKPTKALPAHFSAQQRAAITTDEPLVLNQAGAGTGKSTVILGRIDYLVDCGVKPEDITVLSFTNAAADNITERNSSVGSMTIARMIHDIYSLNNPTHELSSIDTIVNSMDIFYPHDSFVAAFRKRLVDIDKKEVGATTAMNSFIETYYDRVIAVLDTLRQTCLELEIIIAYQRIEHMAEPPHVQSKYLIIDEVQDNSIFEFIYVLKYVAKHLENLFIVGDASQTLYEFRAANPRALNALEGSGVFKTYQLTTNYRSNQEILDFANVHLSDIEANQAAQLQLRANSLEVPTKASFNDKVRLEYRSYPTNTLFNDELPALMKNVVKPYVDERLALGEQVAFLAWSRRHVSMMEEALKDLYPNQHVMSLVSEKSYASDVFTKYVKAHWNEVCQVAHRNAPFVIHKGIENNLTALVGVSRAKSAQKPIMAMVSDWWTTNASTVLGWCNLVDQGALSREAFFDQLRTSLIDYEIRHNSIKQSLMNQKNRERKEKNLAANARLVVSTVHGAKGLEFDSVVVLHKFDSQMAEDHKRMYYVAFTRAMKSELILSWGTVKKPRIESDYQQLEETLAARDRHTALIEAGLDPDMASEDETEAALATFTAKQADAAVMGAPSDEAVALPEEPGQLLNESVPSPQLDEDGSDDGPNQGTNADDSSAFTGATV